MDIKYLTQLHDNQKVVGSTPDAIKILVPISMAEITNLEISYNGGNPFPTALVELLFLAGSYCYVLDYGWNDTQEEMQNGARSLLTKYNVAITRPFFVIDVYNSSEQFLFVYLDEGNDPQVYEADMPEKPGDTVIRGLKASLSEYINSLVIVVLNGGNPF